MKSLRFPHLTAMCVVIAGALTVSPGCATSADARATVSSMGAFGNEVAKVKDSIDTSLKALETLVGSQPSTINANFGAYSKTVTALDKQARVVRGRAEEMRSKGNEFFKEWEDSENVTPARRAELSAAYGKIKEDMTAAKDQFTPFLASLKDIESYLKVDASMTGINSMADLVKKAKDNGAQVNSSIDAVLNQVNSVRGMLSTKG